MTNRQDTGHPDSDQINFREKEELDYWAKKWNISVEDLRASATRAADRSVRAIHDALTRMGKMAKKI